jgi:hypothetical protein
MANQEQRALADDEVLLSDGRIVKMREGTGADEISVAQMLGDRVSLQGAGAQILIQANALKTIESIDGQNPPVLRTYNDFLAFARQFKTKDLNKITRKYAELNIEADPENPLA